MTDYTPQLGMPATAVVITGGASGIGLAAAHALAAVGRPVALWDINAAGAKAAAAQTTNLSTAPGFPSAAAAADR